MATPVLGNADRLLAAAGIQAALANTTVDLYTAGPNPIRANGNVSDYTLAAYTGYAAASVVAWSAPFLDSAGLGATAMPSVHFNGPSSGNGTVVVGVVISHSNHTVFDGACVFDTPITLGLSTDYLDVMAQFNTAGIGSLVVQGSTVP